jgi:hypothetical protein
MAIQRFPSDPSQSVGRFWVAGGDEDNAAAGVCRVEGDLVEIEVSEPLTPWAEAKHELNSVTVKPLPEGGDFVIHGNIPFNPGLLTFIGARTSHRRTVGVPLSGGPELHRVRADWCIAGAHVDGPDTQYTEVRARFTHLELWAQSFGVDLTYIYEPTTEVTLTFVPPAAVEAPFVEFGEAAELKLETTGTMSPPDVWGGQIQTKNWLALEGLSGWTLDEALARFVRPVQTLLTLLAGRQCDVLQVEVKVDDRWCAVYGDSVKPDPALPKDDTLLLRRDGLSLEVFGAWCGMTKRLSPTPQVVAAAVSGSFQSVEAEALALTTTAEGLDRVLYPNSYRFTKDEVADAVVALASSDVPVKVRKELVSALNLYFAEDSYPTRMKRLATDVATAVPQCVGEITKWKNGIRDERVALAHALGGDNNDAGDALWAMHAQVRSLRWALVVRLLQEAGVPDETLTESVSQSEEFKRSEKMWRAQHPGIFPAAQAAAPAQTAPQ